MADADDLYLVTASCHYYPNGGTDDWQRLCFSLEEAESYFTELVDSKTLHGYSIFLIHVVSSNVVKVVDTDYSGNIFDPGSDEPF